MAWQLLSDLAAYAAVFLLGYWGTKVVFNLFFHPLAAFPGPILNRASVLPWAWSLVRGRLPFDVLAMHNKYGPVVRIGPGELSFSDAAAWRDIYGRRTDLAGGFDELPKHLKSYRFFRGLPATIISADRADHAVLRKQLARGFSDQALQRQERLIGGYVDLLVQRLRENSGAQPQGQGQGRDGGAGGRPLDLTAWYNWTTFDIIGDLSFGEPFGCLQNSAYDHWVRVVYSAVKQIPILLVLNQIGISLVMSLVSRIAMKSRQKLSDLAQEKIIRRKKLGLQRYDLIEGLLQKQDELKIDMPTIQANAGTIIIAGSETTATLLCGVTYFLLTNRASLERVTEEVRSTFKTAKDIKLTTVGNLSYMMACLNEAMRCYPPVAMGTMRQVPPGGAQVAGSFVPAGTKLSIFQYAINHNEKYWKDPFVFDPRRFLGDAKYSTDKLDALQPFSLGPRNCVGKNLAYAEMRLILAHMIFHFDLELADDSRGWLQGQKAFQLWDKPPLNVYLTPVASKSG